MAAAGLPVPVGFHITTAAYRRFVMENELQEKILSAVSGASAVAADQPATLEEASKQIAELFAQRAMLDEIVRAIRQAFARELARRGTSRLLPRTFAARTLERVTRPEV